MGTLADLDPVLDQAPLGIVLLNSLGEVEALSPGAPEPHEFADLRRVLDALRDHIHPQRVGEADDRTDDRGVVGIDADTVDERAVDLQDVDREPFQVREGREAGPEVVDRDLHAEGPEAGQDAGRLLHVVHDRCLGQFEAEPFGGEICRGERLELIRGRLRSALAEGCQAGIPAGELRSLVDEELTQLASSEAQS